jgi:hypothetical protein
MELRLPDPQYAVAGVHVCKLQTREFSTAQACGVE